MKFAAFAIAEAEGTILAHSVQVSGRLLRKGRMLTADDIRALAAGGIATITAARLEADDVGEDIAAARVAAALIGKAPRGVTTAAPFTGRANVQAAEAGVLLLNRATIDAANAIDERITIATLEPQVSVASGQLAATIKIIPFAVPEEIVARVEQRLTSASGAGLSVAPFTAHRAGLIISKLPGSKPSVLDKRRDVIRDRLAACGSELAMVETVQHEAPTIAAALRRQHAAGLSPLLVFAATAIVDRGDVIPAALLQAGGEIERLGMPVDPGNLLLMGRLEATPVIGIPSCAASPKLNGFDLVLTRVLAGLDVGHQTIGAMGVGGLLKEISTRPQPRESSVTPEGAPTADGARHAARIAALVLAAGKSSRMGAQHKLLADLGGKPMIRHTVEALLASRARPVIVVVGARANEMCAALAGLDCEVVENAAFAAGMSTSLIAGLAAVPASCDGALIALGDMPRVPTDVCDRLIAAFSPADGRDLIIPVRGTKRGNPVLWGKRYFAEMRGVTGDQGARSVLARYTDAAIEIDAGTDAIFLDIDTPDALAAARAT